MIPQNGPEYAADRAAITGFQWNPDYANDVPQAIPPSSDNGNFGCECPLCADESEDDATIFDVSDMD